MSQPCTKQLSSRHKFPFADVPTVRGSIHGGSNVRYSPKLYGAILDCTFEMADQVASANGIEYALAIKRVLRDEGWHILPRHQQLILTKLSQEK